MPTAPRGHKGKKEPKVLGRAARWRGVHAFMNEHLWRDVAKGEVKAFMKHKDTQPKAEFVCEDKSGELSSRQASYRKTVDPVKRGTMDHRKMENHTNNTTNTGAVRKRAVSLSGGVKSAFAALESIGVTPSESEVKVKWDEAMVITTLDQVCTRVNPKTKAKETVVIEVKTTGNFERQGMRDSVLRLTKTPITRQDKYFFQNLINEILYEKTYPGVPVVDNLAAVTDGKGHARVYRMPQWIRDLKPFVADEMVRTRLSQPSSKHKIKNTSFMSRRTSKYNSARKPTTASASSSSRGR